MQFDFESMSATERFEFLTGTVVPRPIALITTLAPDGTPNAAPYSFFGLLGIDPPIVGIGVLPMPDGSMKDTGRYILDTGEFVINLVSEALAQAMNETCIDAPPGVDEIKLAGLPTVPAQKVLPPRIASSPVAMECRLHMSVPLGPGQVIILGHIVQAHVVDDCVIDAEQLVFDTPAFKLIGAMHAAKWYATTAGRFEMTRPSWSDRTRGSMI